MFDLIGEMNDENYNSKYMDTIENFNSNLLPEHLDYFADVDETGASVKMSGVSDGGDGNGINVVNVNVSGEKPEGSEVHCEVSGVESVDSEINGVNNEISDVNKMSSEVHSAKSGIIKDGDSREDTVDQEVNKYVNVFSDISSDDNFEENAEIPVRHYVSQNDEAQGQLIDAEGDNDVVASDNDLNDAEINGELYIGY